MRRTRVRSTPRRTLLTNRTDGAGRRILLTNTAGRAEYKKRLWNQYRVQGGICDKCHEPMKLINARFKYRGFKDGEVNPLICNKHQGKGRDTGESQSCLGAIPLEQSDCGE